MKQNSMIGLLAICVLGLLVFVIQFEPKKTVPKFNAVNYDFTLKELRTPMLTGGEKNLIDWKGKIIVLNFWATWCPPCIREIPMFVRKQNEWRNKGVQFIGFSMDDFGSVAAFAEEKKINYPNMLGTIYHLGMTKELGNQSQSLPFTVLIDENFKVVKTFLGEVSEAYLDKMLNKLVKEREKI